MRSTRRNPLPPPSDPIPPELRGKRKRSGDDVPSKRRRSNTSCLGDSSMTSDTSRISGAGIVGPKPIRLDPQVPPVTPSKMRSRSNVHEASERAGQIPSLSASSETPSSSAAVVNAMAGPSTPRQPHPSTVPSTPVAQISHSGTVVPTPARDILRMNVDQLSSAAETILPRPPTPPQITERSARNGYPAWATPRTTVKRPPSTFVTRQAMTAARPGIRAPLPVQPVPFDFQFKPPLQHLSERPVAPLPNRACPYGSATPATQPQPCATPSTKKITVPVPFRGTVGQDTQAAVNRVQATPCKTTTSRPPAMPRTPGPTSTKPAAPTSQANAPEKMNVDDEVVGLVNHFSTEETMDGGPMDGRSNNPQKPRPESSQTQPDPCLASRFDLSDRSPESSPPPPVTPAAVLVAPPPTSTARILRKRAPTISTSLPARRPHSRPVLNNASMGPPPLPNAVQCSANQGAIKPSAGPRYPSSLGSGPLNRPANRVVSSNYRSISAPTPTSTRADEPSGRSLSYPAGRDVNKDKENAAQSHAKTKPRESLSLSSRRADTSLCISSLDDTLARLKSRNKPDFKAAPRRVLASASVSEEKGEKAKPLCSSSRLALAPMSHTQERHSAPSRFQVLVDNHRQTTTLKGVVAFVDVHSTDGTDGGAPFIDMLKLSGARVLKRVSESCTHIIYKDGKPSTAAFWRRLPECKRANMHVVGIKWLTMCRERAKWVDEALYRVDLNEQAIFQAVSNPGHAVKLTTRNASPWSRSGSRPSHSWPNWRPRELRRCPDRSLPSRMPVRVVIKDLMLTVQRKCPPR